MNLLFEIFNRESLKRWHINRSKCYIDCTLVVSILILTSWTIVEHLSFVRGLGHWIDKNPCFHFSLYPLCSTRSAVKHEKCFVRLQRIEAAKRVNFDVKHNKCGPSIVTSDLHRNNYHFNGKSIRISCEISVFFFFFSFLCKLRMFDINV